MTMLKKETMNYILLRGYCYLQMLNNPRSALRQFMKLEQMLDEGKDSSEHAEYSEFGMLEIRCMLGAAIAYQRLDMFNEALTALRMSLDKLQFSIMYFSSDECFAHHKNQHLNTLLKLSIMIFVNMSRILERSGHILFSELAARIATYNVEDSMDFIQDREFYQVIHVFYNFIQQKVGVESPC